MSAHTAHGLIFTNIIVLPWTLADLKGEIIVCIHILHIEAAAAVACGEILLVYVNFAIWVRIWHKLQIRRGLVRRLHELLQRKTLRLNAIFCERSAPITLIRNKSRVSIFKCLLLIDSLVLAAKLLNRFLNSLLHNLLLQHPWVSVAVCHTLHRAYVLL